MTRWMMPQWNSDLVSEKSVSVSLSQDKTSSASFIVFTSQSGLEEIEDLPAETKFLLVCG